MTALQILQGQRYQKLRKQVERVAIAYCFVRVHQGANLVMIFWFQWFQVMGDAVVAKGSEPVVVVCAADA